MLLIAPLGVFSFCPFFLLFLSLSCCSCCCCIHKLRAVLCVNKYQQMHSFPFLSFRRLVFVRSFSSSIPSLSVSHQLSRVSFTLSLISRSLTLCFLPTLSPVLCFFPPSTFPCSFAHLPTHNVTLFLSFFHSTKIITNSTRRPSFSFLNRPFIFLVLFFWSYFRKNINIIMKKCGNHQKKRAQIINA